MDDGICALDLEIWMLKLLPILKFQCAVALGMWGVVYKIVLLADWSPDELISWRAFKILHPLFIPGPCEGRSWQSRARLFIIDILNLPPVDNLLNLSKPLELLNPNPSNLVLNLAIKHSRILRQELHFLPTFLHNMA